MTTFEIQVPSVPQTDEEVMQSMSEYDGQVRVSLTGIYECYRGMGESVFDAWRHTLEAHLKSIVESNRIQEAKGEQ